MPSTPIATVDPSVGRVLRTARVAAGITRRALARQAGVDHSHLGRFEHGERAVSESFYAHVTAALAVLIEKNDAA
ncbi:MAG TPA: helix-turn-helix transcriptional regulator [Nocardioidaceae bacterium]|jgi:transcriptional regulator with XRE-family HTH domain|nr:helix-turn-helix transcriptional regulator [Nocardioidaceae bacterium]